MNLLLLTGKVGKPNNGLLLLRQLGNGQGLVDMGAMPEAARQEERGRLSGSRSSAELNSLLEAGAIRGLFILGEDASGDAAFGPALEAAELVVAIDALETSTTRAAHVSWPALPVIEAGGTMTAFDRRVRSFAPALEPAVAGAGFAALAQLHAAMTGGQPPTIEAVRRAMAERHPAYARIAGLETGESFYWNDTSAGGETLFAERFATPDGKANFMAPVGEHSLPIRRAATYSSIDVWRERERARLFGRQASTASSKADGERAAAEASVQT